MKIYILGDPQIGRPEQESLLDDKIKELDQIVQKDDILLIPGDLTEHGSNSHFLNIYFEKFINLFGFRHSTNFDNQLDIFINKVYNPLAKIFNNKVFLCHGNHDTYAFPIKPVVNFVRKIHGSHQYSKFINDDTVLICLGNTFSNKNKNFLKKNLLKYSDKKIIIMQHYNFNGPFSDFWPDKDKQSFFDMISPYKDNILFIAHGHIHITQSINIDGFTLINGSGKNNIFFEL